MHLVLEYQQAPSLRLSLHLLFSTVVKIDAKISLENYV